MPRLTKRTIEALQPRRTDYLVFDDEVLGFGVRIYPTGRKAFLVQYRSGGRTRRLKVGRFGILTADEARNQARQLLGDVAKGENPAEDIRARRQAPTVAEVCERFLADHVANRCKPSTQHEYRRMVDRVINPALGTHKIVDITRADIAAFHHSLRNFNIGFDEFGEFAIKIVGTSRWSNDGRLECVQSRPLQTFLELDVVGDGPHGKIGIRHPCTERRTHSGVSEVHPPPCFRRRVEWPGSFSQGDIATNPHVRNYPQVEMFGTCAFGSTSQRFQYASNISTVEIRQKQLAR